MRQLTLITAVLSLTLRTSCAAARYERTVTVERDGQGNITKTTEVEHMTQTGSRKRPPTRYMYERTPQAADKNPAAQ